MGKQNKFLKYISKFENALIFFSIILGYSIVTGADVPLTSTMERFNPQSELLKEIIDTREEKRQKQLKEDILNQKLRKLGIPTKLKTGRGQPEHKFAQQTEQHDNSKQLIDPRAIFHTVMEELVERHGELYEKNMILRSNISINDYCQQLLAPEIVEFIPAPYITAQGFDPLDHPFTTAIKLERLGLIIKDLRPPVISPETYEVRLRIMGKCFALAGSHVDKAVRILKEDPTQEIDIHTLTDMYQTGGLFYHWAAINMANDSKKFMDRLSDNFYNDLKMIQLMCYIYEPA